MAGLYHDFLLLDHSVEYSRWSDYTAETNGITLHDDILFYIQDTTMWIPTFNPSTNKRQFGLNRWGVTIINQDGASKAFLIFKAWLDLFSQGPDLLTLRGLYSFEEDPDGAYDRIQIVKTELTSKLREIVRYLKLTRTGTHYILHWGI
ncbi:hypothetical protein IH992_28095 [Candidatus Poribacteria bacterium]|nr:hypothetical protein [Candidatus Poribacteria bacterium]